MQGIDQLLSLEAMNPQMQQAARVLAKVLATEINKALKGDIKQGITNLSDEARAELEDVFSDLDKQVDISFSNMRKKTEEWTNKIEEAKKKWGEMLKDMNTRLPGVGLGTAMGNVAGGLSSMMGGFGSGGGIIGMFVAAKKAESEWVAGGHRVLQVFKGAGALGKDLEGTAGSLGFRIRDLSDAGKATAQDFMAAASAMTTFGLSARDAALDVPEGLVGDNHAIPDMIQATLELDSVFGQAAGTVAGLGAQLGRTSSFTVGVTTIRDIGLAAREMGLSFQEATGAVMQTSSALRLQAGDTRNLGDMLANMQKYFKGAGVQNAGVTAAATLQSVGQTMSSLSQGWLGKLAQDVMGIQGPGAVVAGQLAMRGRDVRTGEENSGLFGQFVSKMVTELRSVSPGDKLGQMLALQSQGFSVEASEHFVKLFEGVSDQTSIAELAAKHMGDLAENFNQKALTQGWFETMMKKLQSALTDLGLAIYKILSTGLLTIIDLLAGIAAVIGRYFTHDRAAAGDLWRNTVQPRVQANASRMGEGFGEAATAIGNVVKALGPAAKNLLPPGTVNYYKDLFTAPAAPPPGKPQPVPEPDDGPNKRPKPHKPGGKSAMIDTPHGRLKFDINATWDTSGTTELA